MQHPMLMASLIVGAVSTLLLMVGMATTGWAKYGQLTIGLFSYCGTDTCRSYAATGAVSAAKAFVVIGWLCTLAAIIISLVYFCKYVKKDEANRLIPLLGFIFFIISGATAFLGCIIFATKGTSEIDVILRIKVTLSYSFALTIIAAILAFVAGGLMFYHRNRTGSA